MWLNPLKKQREKHWLARVSTTKHANRCQKAQDPLSDRCNTLFFTGMQRQDTPSGSRRVPSEAVDGFRRKMTPARVPCTAAGARQATGLIIAMDTSQLASAQASEARLPAAEHLPSVLVWFSSRVLASLPTQFHL